MCCRTTVNGVGPRALEILQIAGFTGGERSAWIRELDNGTWVTVRLDPQRVVLNVYPPVGSLADHSQQRLAGALMFKIAAFLAEDARCDVLQEASVGQCLLERGKSSILVASYPAMPLRFEHVCPGFREVFLGLDRQQEQEHEHDHDHPHELDRRAS
jgi:hypothetical protein